MTPDNKKRLTELKAELEEIHEEVEDIYTREYNRSESYSDPKLVPLEAAYTGLGKVVEHLTEVENG